MIRIGAFSVSRGTALWPVVLLLGLLPTFSCSKDSPSGKRQATATPARTVPGTQDSAAGSIDVGSTTYRPGRLAEVGSVSGQITLDGAAPPATVPVTRDERVCGVSAPGSVQMQGKNNGLAGTVVWLADVSSGKSLPIDKRSELTSERCLVEPRVLAATVGTTVNVYNEDKLLHRLVFTRLGTHDTLTVMPFFNTGQIVASERLAKAPAIVEVRCTEHPWTRAYILVFDHPYFAVTGPDGSFKIDSLPAGTYKVMAWHEGMSAPVTRQVVVSAGGTATLDLGVQVAAGR